MTRPFGSINVHFDEVRPYDYKEVLEEWERDTHRCAVIKYTQHFRKANFDEYFNNYFYMFPQVNIPKKTHRDMIYTTLCNDAMDQMNDNSILTHEEKCQKRLNFINGKACVLSIPKIDTQDIFTMVIPIKSLDFNVLEDDFLRNKDYPEALNEVITPLMYIVHPFFDFDSIPTIKEYDEVIKWLDSLVPVFGNYSIGGYATQDQFKKLFNNQLYETTDTNAHPISLHVIFYEKVMLINDIIHLFDIRPRKKDQPIEFVYKNINKYVDPSVYDLKKRRVFRHVHSPKLFSKEYKFYNGFTIKGFNEFTNTLITPNGTEEPVDTNLLKEYFGFDVYNPIDPKVKPPKIPKTPKIKAKKVDKTESLNEIDDYSDLIPVNTKLLKEPQSQDATLQRYPESPVKVIMPLEYVRDAFYLITPLHKHEFIAKTDNKFNILLFTFIRNAPYTIETTKNLLHKWYNDCTYFGDDIKHGDENALDDMVDRFYNPHEFRNNSYYTCLTKYALDELETIDEIEIRLCEEQGIEVEDFIAFSKKVRNLRKESFVLETRLYKKLEEKIEANEIDDIDVKCRLVAINLAKEMPAINAKKREINRLYHEFVKRAISLNDKQLLTKPIYNNFFNSANKKLTTLSDTAGEPFAITNKTDLIEYYKDVDSCLDVQKFVRVSINQLCEYRIEQKLAVVDCIDDNDEKVAEAKKCIDIIKSTFTKPFDARVYFDFLRTKLYDHKARYPLNIANHGESGCFKTTLMNIISEFFNVKILKMEDLCNKFNDWIVNASILLIEEVERVLKDAPQAAQAVKMSSDGKVRVEVKNGKNFDVYNFSNMMINSNFSTIGGLFNYQNTNELSRRFYLCPRQTVKNAKDQQRVIDFIFKDENHKYLIYAIKQEIPLTEEELKTAQKNAADAAKITRQLCDYRRVLSALDIRQCINLPSKKTHNRKDKCTLNIRKLTENLRRAKGKSAEDANEIDALGGIVFKKPPVTYIDDIVDFYTFYYYISSGDDIAELVKTLIDLQNEVNRDFGLKAPQIVKPESLQKVKDQYKEVMGIDYDMKDEIELKEDDITLPELENREIEILQQMKELEATLELIRQKKQKLESH